MSRLSPQVVLVVKMQTTQLTETLTVQLHEEVIGTIF